MACVDRGAMILRRAPPQAEDGLSPSAMTWKASSSTRGGAVIVAPRRWTRDCRKARGAENTIKGLGSCGVVCGSGRFQSAWRSNPPVARPQPRFFVPFVTSWWRIADATRNTLPVRESPIAEGHLEPRLRDFPPRRHEGHEAGSAEPAPAVDGAWPRAAASLSPGNAIRAKVFVAFRFGTCRPRSTNTASGVDPRLRATLCALGDLCVPCLRDPDSLADRVRGKTVRCADHGVATDPRRTDGQRGTRGSSSSHRVARRDHATLRVFADAAMCPRDRYRA